jgi:nucleoside-diphosphate-sugar epimerase
MAAPIALVTGASGFIGRALVTQLLDGGYTVRTLSRTSGLDLSAVENHLGDLASGRGITPALFAGVSVVFHCAGEVRDVSVMRRVHVDGLGRLLGSLASSGKPLPHWVQLSSVGAYGRPTVPSDARVVDEMTRENPTGEYEITKTEADRMVRAFAAEHHMPFTILRPSTVIGTRMPNRALPAVIRMVERGWFFYVGTDGAVANFIHESDVARALVTCAAMAASRGETFNVSSDCSWVALVEYVARARGVRAPRLRVPESLLRRAVSAIGSVVPVPLTADRICALVSRTQYPITKIERVLGFRCAKPMPQALDDVLAAAG